MPGDGLLRIGLLRIGLLRIGALALVLFAPGALALEPERPGVVLLLCDDLGWGDLRAFREASEIETPQLDAMARAGLRFTRFYAAAPVCSPTRGSCLTGRHPYRYGVYTANAGHLKPAEITLPELLRSKGYTTGHFGKWHLGTLSTTVKDSNRGGPRGKAHHAPPGEHGYDTWFVTEAKVPTYDPMLRPPKSGKTAWDPIRDGAPSLPYGTRYWTPEGAVSPETLRGDDSALIADRAIEFIEGATEDARPFFAAVWFHAPHLPVVAGDKHRLRYARHDVHRRNYYGSITALDEQVGRIRARLRALGVAESTMLWFASDNGPEGASNAPGSAGPFRGRKRSLLEGGIRVPGIVEWPGVVRPGSETSYPAVTSDYLPTLLEALEISLPDERPIDGISLLPLLRGETMPDRAIGFRSRRQLAWTTVRDKLYSSDDGANWALYDLDADPGESRDISAERPELLERRVRELRAWMASCARSDRGEDYPRASQSLPSTSTSHQ